MANAKEVRIEVIVPYNWMNDLSEREAKVFCSWFLGPTGFKIRYEPHSRLISLPSGGRLTMYHLFIEGVEAVWNDTLAGIVWILEQQACARIVRAEVRDLDNRGGWLPIKPEKTI